MGTLTPESLSNKFLTKWLSFIILKRSNIEIVTCFRKVEGLTTRITKLKSHLSFNETCLINKLLPTYTNVRIHDGAARREEFVLKFRQELIERQITEQKEELSTMQDQLIDAENSLKNLVSSQLRYNALNLFLRRLITKLEEVTRMKHTRKLCNLFGGHLPMKQVKDSVINLSNINLDDRIKEILS